ncbi:hypothetical protein F1189_16225 [Rhodovastum atsumiense]|uniref:Uncharacterized protein n=2 Tax=Rhodovastum atsumiense TaxID=504468 RepID=A0A5M6IUN9_9PROT|nr:hypothetical protein F1189_16225 [Rhodovastum atsumiense]
MMTHERPWLRLGRRAMLAGLLALPAGAAGAALLATDRSFRVLADGRPIGTHAVRFSRRGEALEASSTIRLAVTVGPLTVFRFTHQAVETWQGQTFVRIESQTNDDGTKLWMRAMRQGGGVTVEGSAGRHIAPAAALPSTWWNRAVLAAPLFSAQDGQMYDKQVTAGPLETLPGGDGSLRGWRHSVTVGTDVDVWYDLEGRWAGLRFHRNGKLITYLPE